MFKPITLFTTLLFALLLLSCQKELSVEGGKGGNPNVIADFRMKINGTQWTATKDISVSLLAGFININGTSADNKALAITLTDTVPGTYVLDQRSFHAAALSDSADVGGISYSTDQGKDSTEAGGEVVIKSINKANKTISGTFHFRMFREFDKKQKVITEGTFSNLAYSVSLPPASQTDTFRVKIDNIDWSGKSITAITSGSSIIINSSELDLSKLVALSFPSAITTGTYDLDALGGTYIGLYSPNPASFLASQTGKLTILEHNRSSRRVRGNFNFKGVEQGGSRSALLTAGYFSVVYQ